MAALLAFALEPAAWGQAPLLSEQVDVLDAEQLLVFEWKMDAANRALEAGLAVLAEGLYRELLQQPGVTSDVIADLQIQLSAALIAQRRFVGARSELEAIVEGERTNLYYLYMAVSVYGNGRNVDMGRFEELLDQVSEAELPAKHLPWFYILRGLRAEFAGRSNAVAVAFNRARDTATSEMQRAFIDALILREEIFQSPASDALEAQARGRYESLIGTSAAYPFVRQYAIILHNQGRTQEALDVITQELANVGSGYTSREREQLLLLKGLLYGADTLSGRDALRALVREGSSREVMVVALQLLAGAKSDLEQAELNAFLNTMIDQVESHPLRGQMYYIRSQLALARADQALAKAKSEAEKAVAKADARLLFGAAEADARLLLEQFPGLTEITNVYRLLAYAALQRTPPQYRAAADFLIQLRDQAETLESRQVLNRLIGDCYFLNSDYRNAIDFYTTVRFKGEGVDHDGELFLRLVTAEVRAGEIDAALGHLDEADFSGSISVSDRWRAEWNVAQALQSSGKLGVALTRVRLLLSGGGSSSVPASLDLRLRWLEARLAFMSGDDEGVQQRVDHLLARIESIPEGEFAPADARLLRTELLLLKADILIGDGDATAGMEVLGQLRTGFAQSSAAERSYLTEANYHASIGDFEAAQRTLLQLSTVYEQSRLAPQALFEAGLYCERRGPAYFEEAVRVHHELIERYPLDALFFAARLKQGDLLRQMNKFEGAQRIYENLIHLFPEHPRRYVAELSRSDCMLALAKDDKSQLLDVALALERLINIPNLPIDFQAEVGYKWGFALMQREAFDEAQTVFTLISSRFLLEGENATRLGVTGRYWMSRSLLELGARLEESGELAEARRVYRKMVAFNLPGRNLAQSRANRLPIVE